MKFELYGLTMDAPGASFFLWSPWRSAALEHKLFEALANTPGATLERLPDELRLDVADSKGWQYALTNIERVLKGWQEEGVEAGNEKRSWRWLLEADIDANGFDHKGEKSAFWLFLRLAIDVGGPGEPDKGEDVDLNNFGVCVWGAED